jgi:DNA-binding FadR family transcriptional regulator
MAFNLDRRKLSDQVAAQLEAAIIDGHYVPGDRLPAERALMCAFSVGRPTIREAVFSLRKKGLIETVNGTRPRVVIPEPGALLKGLSSSMRYLLMGAEAQRHFQELRSFFEIGLVRYAAMHASQDDLARLKDALAANKDALSDMAEFQRTDIAFHDVLAEIRRNPVFLALHNAIADWLADQRQTTLLEPDQARIAHKDHTKIYRAVAARNADLAQAAMTAHLSQLYRIYWQVNEDRNRGRSDKENRAKLHGITKGDRRTGAARHVIDNRARS